MTSIAARRASAAATSVLPTPVGPAITTSGPFTRSLTYVSVYQRNFRQCPAAESLPGPLELPPDIVQRHAAHDGPAMRAEVRRLGRRELDDEPLHLLARQRHVGFHGRAAGDECERSV